MRQNLRKTLTFLVALTLCFTYMAIGQAEEIFSETFQDSSGISSRNNVRISETVVGNTVYYMIQDGSIYTWNPDQRVYEHFTKVEARQFINIEIPFTRQSDAVQKAYTETVSMLVPSEEGLYGFNDISGLIGLIDKDGWHKNEVRLDTSKLRSSEDDYPDQLINSFMYDGKMYAFYDRIWINPGTIDTSLLVFNLADGTCDVKKLPGVIVFNRYKHNKLICIKDSGNDLPILSVYDFTSNAMNDLGISIPTSMSRGDFSLSWQVHSKLGGLAYDQVRDRIYYADESGIWGSFEGKPFEQIPLKGPWLRVSPLARAYVLSSGAYVTLNGGLGIRCFEP